MASKSRSGAPVRTRTSSAARIALNPRPSTARSVANPACLCWCSRAAPGRRKRWPRPLALSSRMASVCWPCDCWPALASRAQATLSCPAQAATLLHCSLPFPPPARTTTAASSCNGPPLTKLTGEQDAGHDRGREEPMPRA